MTTMRITATAMTPEYPEAHGNRAARRRAAREGALVVLRFPDVTTNEPVHAPRPNRATRRSLAGR